MKKEEKKPMTDQEIVEWHGLVLFAELMGWAEWGIDDVVWHKPEEEVKKILDELEKKGSERG